MANALCLHEDSSILASGGPHNSSPYPPRVTVLRVRVLLRQLPHARAYCEQAMTLGPLLHRSLLCMFGADTRALPIIAIGPSILAVPLVSEPQSSQRHTALLLAPTVGSSSMSPWLPFLAPPLTARCQPCHAAHLASPSAILPVALHRSQRAGLFGSGNNGTVLPSRARTK